MAIETYGYRVWTERDRTTSAEWLFGKGADRIRVLYNSYGNGTFTLTFWAERYRFEYVRDLPEHIRQIVFRDMGAWSRFGPTEIGLCTRPIDQEC